MIFVSIPALLILKCLDDDDKGICRSFFPPMFGEDDPPSSRSSNNEESEEPSQVDKVAVHNKFLDLKKIYTSCRSKSTNEYDFFNLVERCILGMEDDDNEKDIADKEFEENGLKKEEMKQMV